MQEYPNRTFINPRDEHKRKIAFMVREHNKKKYPSWAWRVGLTFSNHLALDFDREHGATEDSVSGCARWLAYEYKLAPVGIFETEHGWWIVSQLDISRNVFTELYEMLLNDAKAGVMHLKGFDIAHAEISLKYGKTTLRISSKDVGAVPCKLIRTIEPEVIVP